MEEVGSWRQYASKVKLGYVIQYALGNRALDIGSGRGWYARALADQGMEVHAIDWVTVPIEGVCVICALAEALPYTDASFDTVLMFDVLEHVYEEEHALAELARVCRHRLILSVPNGADETLVRYNLTFAHRRDRNHLRDYTADRLQALLETHGFEVILLRPENPVLPEVFAEFVCGPRWLRLVISLGIAAFRRLGLLSTKQMMADLFVVADRGQVQCTSLCSRG